MSPLEQIQELVGLGAFTLLKHCRDGMRAHGIKSSDALAIVMRATECHKQDDGRYRFEGYDLSENDVRAIVELELAPEGEVVFISVHLVAAEGG